MPVQQHTTRLVLPLDIKAAGADSWSAIRGLHSFCIRILGENSIEPAQAEAFVDFIYSPDYTDALMTHDVQTAWHDGRLVGTAGWVPSDDAGTSARITSVYVSPLFSRLGIGRHIVGVAEAHARAAGFSSFTTRAFHPSVAFFKSLGYVRSSQGVQSMGNDNGIPVTFMRRSETPVLRQLPTQSVFADEEPTVPEPLATSPIR